MSDWHRATEPISETMAAALTVAREHNNKLIRLPGGFWTFEGCPWNGSAPTQYFGTTTIQGLVARGRMRYSRHQEHKRGGGSFPVEAEVVAP